MKSNVKIRGVLFFVLILSSAIYSQVGINNTSPNATLDVTASNTATPANNDGILIPRVDNFPTTNPTASQDGMMLFVTGNGTPAKGFYYWDNSLSSWLPVTGAQNTLDQAYDEGGAGAGRTISADNGAVRIAGGDGFQVTGNTGSGAIIGAPGAGTRMFFNPRKAAFRVGEVSGTEWDNANVGDYSFAAGFSTIASGSHSTAMGFLTTASGLSSIATGDGSTASGFASIAMGQGINASGNYSFATGSSTTASGSYSTAIGNGSNASGSNSTALGQNTTASGSNSTALGNSTIASGSYSTAMGNNIAAPSFGETTIGTHSTNYTPASAIAFNSSDRIFSIGNGTDSANRSNALTIYKSGLMNINDEYNMPLTDGTANQVMATNGSGQLGFVNPSAIFTDTNTQNTLDQAYDEGGAGAGRTITADNGAVSIAGTDGFQVIGTYNSGATINLSGTGAKMFFNPRKAAFRVGFSIASQWDLINVGDFSFASGYSTTASGNYSLAMGESTGATGENSTAMGSYTVSSGKYSTVMGYHTIAPSYAETTIGVFSQLYSPSGTTTFVSSDRLFTIGNGINAANPSNALTIYKSGLMNINDEYNMPLTDGTANQVMVTNGSGQVSFVNPSAIFTDTQNTLDQSYDEGGAGAGRTITADSGAVRIAGTDGFQVSGTFGNGATIGTPGAGTRMFFNPRKSAFRVGYVTGTQWDNTNVGNYSFASGYGTMASGENAVAMGYGTTASAINAIAIGYNATASGIDAVALGGNTTASNTFATAFGGGTTASGNNSTAMGNNSVASGFDSTAMGNSTAASGNSSTAMGKSTVASGNSSIAFGENTLASGFRSTSMGYFTEAPSFVETVIGTFSTTYSPLGGTSGFNSSDRIFSIGNGTDSANRSNALTIYKSGLMNINDEYNMPLTDGTANQVMATNGAGQVSFVDPSSVYGDADWYENSGTPPNNINDNIYTYGNVGIGTTAFYRLDVSDSQASSYVARFNNTNTDSGSGGIRIRLARTFSGSSNYYIGFYSGFGTNRGRVAGNGSGVLYETASDRRLKTNIISIEKALELIDKIQPRKYEYKELKGKEEYGFIAQELQTVYPQAVSGDPNGNVETAPMMVDYSRLTPILTAGIKELKEQNEELKKELEKLKTDNEKLKKQLNRFVDLENRISNLENKINTAN